MTLLRFNPSIEFLSLRNNNISDTAIQCLHTFWSFSLSFPQLDLRNNPIMQSSSFALLRCVRPPVLFSPQDPLPLPRYPLDVIADKAFRDCCIVLQLLDCLLAVSRQNTVPAKIPKKLLFSRALPTHRRTSGFPLLKAKSRENSSNSPPFWRGGLTEFGTISGPRRAFCRFFAPIFGFSSAFSSAAFRSTARFLRFSLRRRPPPSPPPLLSRPPKRPGFPRDRAFR